MQVLVQVLALLSLPGWALRSSQVPIAQDDLVAVLLEASGAGWSVRAVEPQPCGLPRSSRRPGQRGWAC